MLDSISNPAPTIAKPDARKSAADELVSAWNAASNVERVEFAKRIGANTIWNECVAPAIEAAE